MDRPFRVELYHKAPAEVLSAEFLDELRQKWAEVGKLLQNVGEGGIASLAHLEITLLADAEMARVHGQFLNDPTPTDVITFDHGELLIGIETAARQAARFGTSQAREIALYGIHGMLHLSGFDDKQPEDAEIMAIRQFELLAQFFPEL